ncbi:ABC transporter permease [Catalinimonas alkaloidigena]|uniref:ABC transporter permease n=1 Tax=Catalinimonas alkaloidigena TaxID=1075417 RepID=UPI002405C668|nr:FtsX-like permease family protein [Catalinimonas alkaloidigena]
MFLTLAWRNLWRNKRRTFITMASIIFAVLLAILLNSVKEGMLDKMQENVVSYYTGAVQVHKKGYWNEKTIDNTFEINSSHLQEILLDEKVNQLVPRLESFALAASEGFSRGCMVVGIAPEGESSVTSLEDKLIAGKYLEQQDRGVLLSEGLAEYLKISVGDTLVLIGQGFHGASAAGKYPIQGLVSFASPELNKLLVYLPIAEAQWLFAAEQRATALVLQIDDINNSQSVAQQLAASLGEEYEFMSWQTMMPELDQIIQGERAENNIFLFVLYLLITFGIFGTILMMTVERQFEFGVLVAIGMRRLKLSSIVILENILIAILGALAGMLLSLPVVFYFYNFPIRITGELSEAYENFGFEPIFYFSVKPMIFYSQTVVVLCIALALSIYPMIKIGRLDPVSAMRG